MIEKQTYKELSKQSGLSIPVIQSRLDRIEIIPKKVQPRSVMMVMDTTYFKGSFGLMVFRDIIEGENLLWKYVRYETIAHYQDGISTMKEKGFEVLGITTDGRRGIFKAFQGIPIQMCHFHQKQIVRRYITNNPKLEAGIELKEIVSRLTITDKESFAGWLGDWFLKWRKFLNEKTVNHETPTFAFQSEHLERFSAKTSFGVL